MDTLFSDVHVVDNHNIFVVWNVLSYDMDEAKDTNVIFWDTMNK